MTNDENNGGGFMGDGNAFDEPGCEEQPEVAEVEREEPEDQPYDGGGWPGDGSGTDDLADYNQNEADDYRNEGE